MHPFSQFISPFPCQRAISLFSTTHFFIIPSAVGKKGRKRREEKEGKKKKGRKRREEKEGKKKKGRKRREEKEKKKKKRSFRSWQATELGKRRAGGEAAVVQAALVVQVELGLGRDVAVLVAEVGRAGLGAAFDAEVGADAVDVGKAGRCG